ncbi:uncharacterized protein LOC6734293 [Drosophila simulans]|uniref:GD25772 n=1 Tax=Drosophila simulans TaxID=7240 RepID=B4QE13_DROSI|nr:uncharacterized protein LOC6734293 [Drosophila simulans]EDX06907.1 GD25772 [Drosophila simulans]KMY93462.1 uncharacterized protein Dsimw501_GD25772 [Drosophila simulans]
MSQNPASMEEVLHVVEANEACEKSEVDTVPVVVPPESTAEPEGISKPEEASQPVGDEPQEEKPQIEPAAITAQEATEEGQEAGTTEHVAIEATELGNEVQPTEGSDELSPEEKKLKLKKERKERLKNFATTRFAPMAIESPVHFTPEHIEEIRDNEEEEEEHEQLVNFDEPTIGDGVSVSSSVLTVDSEDYPFQAPKLVSLFPTYGFTDGPVDRNIFQSDVKYEDIDNSVSLTGISIVSTRTLKTECDPDSVQLKTNFLRDFDVPSLSDISEEHDASPQSLDARSVISVQDDHGFFADPTSNMDSGSSSSSESIGDVDKEQQAEEAAPESEVDSLDVSDIPEFDEIPVVKREEQNQGSLDAFSTLSKVAFAVPEVRDDPTISHALEIKAVVRELLYDLFEETASLSDVQNKDNKIRAKLDKNKLLSELDKVITTFLYERYTNEMVGNRLVEYYKRNRNARVFAPLSPENEKRFHTRYMHALDQLDSLKYRLDVAKHKHAIQMNRVILDLHSAQSVASITEERLEHLFREHLVRSDSDNLRRLVDRELRMMTAKRNEISDSRLFLITRKHTLGRIMGKIKELDTLSETLSIEDFLAVQNNVFALQKKIEERNTDLKRMRTQFLMDVHLTRHNREKALALAENFELSKMRLRSAIKNQRVLRRRLYEVKLERKKMRQQSKDMTFHGGILAMPSLMYDYDNTVERLKEKRETVAKLKETMKSLQRRLSCVEGRSI